MVKQKFDAKKLQELMLYVAERSFDDEDFGATKLNKILYSSDFFAYGSFGTPITGARYQRLQHGPAPKELMPIQDKLLKRGDAVVHSRLHHGGPQKRLLAQRAPDLSLFSGPEIAIVDEVINMLRGLSARRVSLLTHDHIWTAARDLEEIPYETVFVSGDTPTPMDIRRGIELALKHGWLSAV